MTPIELDGLGWTERLEFWHVLRNALSVMPDHDTGFAAFGKSVFYQHDMLTVRPPFRIVVRKPAPEAVADIELMGGGLGRTAGNIRNWASATGRFWVSVGIARTQSERSFVTVTGEFI